MKGKIIEEEDTRPVRCYICGKKMLRLILRKG